MGNKEIISKEVFELVGELSRVDDVEITQDTSLLGDAGILDSMNLVQLCIESEDRAYDLGFEFDWTSESAMSKSRGVFRTLGTLMEEFFDQGGISE